MWAPPSGALKGGPGGEAPLSPTSPPLCAMESLPSVLLGHVLRLLVEDGGDARSIVALKRSCREWRQIVTESSLAPAVHARRLAVAGRRAARGKRVDEVIPLIPRLRALLLPRGGRATTREVFTVNSDIGLAWHEGRVARKGLRAPSLNCVDMAPVGPMTHTFSTNGYTLQSYDTPVGHTYGVVEDGVKKLVKVLFDCTKSGGRHLSRTTTAKHIGHVSGDRLLPGPLSLHPETAVEGGVLIRDADGAKKWMM